MNIVDPRQRQTACYDPLGGQRQDNKDHVPEYEGPKIGDRINAEKCLVGRDIGTSLARQKRDQASSNLSRV